MRLKPGSFAWLVAHDLRQSWRAFASLFGDMARVRIALVIGAAILALHLVAWPVALWIGAMEDGPAGSAALSAYTASGAIFVLPWIIAQSMTATTRALYGRGDLDLLFASPISARVVLGARALVMAIDAIASVATLLLPLANVNALAGHPHWLAIYPALLASGLFGSGLGLGLALALFLLVGPKRTRLVSQVAATLVGASFVLGVQGFNLLPAPTRAWVLRAFAAPESASAATALDLLWLPVRAASGEPGAILAWLLLGVIVFAAATLAFGERFAAAAILSAGAPVAGGRERKARAFRASLGATLRAKERRLVWRDPWLMSQMLLQIVYTLPVGVILWRNGGVTGSVGLAFTPTIVVISAQLAGSLAWVALSGEDAPEFLATAPVTRGQIERRKIEAIALPIALLLGAPILAVTIASPWSGLCATLFSLGAGASAALINLWRQSPSRKSMVLRRHSQSKLVGLIEHLLSILWAVAACTAILRSWTVLIPVALIAFTLWLNRPRSQSARKFSPSTAA